MAQPSTPATWSSRPAFLMATIGAAVGLGNLWRFPYIAGENGGGGFVLMYLGFVFLLGLPIVTAEILMGRRGGGSAIATMAKLIREENASPLWKTIGWISVLVPVVGLSYYAVVAAWALDYFGLAAVNAFDGFDAESAEAAFNGQIGAPIQQALLHGLFMAMTVAVVARGVNSGIERVSRFLMPALFFVIVLLALYGVFRGDFRGALEFLFRPDFSSINGRSVLIALGQALFSLAIGV
ncbi:MAG: sodium-dependent transporter, partial [Pseudomonadota bacterium]